MNEWAALLGIGAAMAVGAASPGPSFILIARTAAGAGRANGLSAALGMGLGGMAFATLSLLGLNAVFQAVPALYLVLKVVGGAYLAYLGWRIWRGAKQPLALQDDSAAATPMSRRGYLLLGLGTQVSNPKTAIVYASVFASFLPPSPSLRFQLLVVALVFLIEVSWYAVVALALSASAPRAVFLRYKAWVDRTAGGIMGALGLKLAVSASQA